MKNNLTTVTYYIFKLNVRKKKWKKTMNTQVLASNDRNFFWSRIIVVFFFLTVVAVTHFPSSAWMGNLTKNYLPFHIVLEFIGILVSFSVFSVGWATYKNVQSADILVLSVVCFMTGWLDLGHTLSFTGMPDFVTPSGPNKAIVFWLVSRFTGSMGFLFLSVAKPPELKTKTLSIMLFVASVAWVGFWFWITLYREDLIPPMFIPGGIGLTRLKLILEWSTIALSAAAGVIFFHKGLRDNLVNLHWLGCACFLFAMSGYFFTVYRSFDDLYNFAGHVYKAIAFLLVYRAIFVECISKPYQEVQRSAREALEANAAKSKFLANVSHEFRTPLGVITGFSDMLSDSPNLDSESRQWSEMISKNAKQLRALIDDLLDLAKAENEKISVQWAPFSPVEVIEEVVSGLRLQAQKKNVQLVFASDLEKNNLVISDRMRFSQILLNIIGNSVKFTSVGEVRVHLKATQSFDGIEITVQDTGLGITSSQAKRLFQPFSQANDVSSRRFGGTGLGLALSKKLTSLLGGELWLEKSEAGKGSLFIFTIKNQKIEDVFVEIEKIPKVAHVADFHDLRILAAEDSLDNQSLLHLYLKPTNATITFANNGFEAVKFVETRGYDLILMDIQMPEMDGFEAVEKLRQKNWCGPILALSAHAHEPERNRALKNGFDGYLVKPITREKLWESIAYFTNHTY